MNQTSRNELWVGAPDVSGQLTLGTVVIMEPAPVLVDTPFAVIRTYQTMTSALPSSLRVGAGYTVPVLPSVLRRGATSLKVHKTRSSHYRVTSAAGSVEEAEAWLQKNRPEHSRCVVTLGNHPAVLAQLPAEVRRCALVGELSLGAGAPERVYVVMTPLEAKIDEGYLVYGPPAQVKRKSRRMVPRRAVRTPLPQVQHVGSGRRQDTPANKAPRRMGAPGTARASSTTRPPGPK